MSDALMRRRAPQAPAARGATNEQFEQLQASVLFCNRCRAPRPVRERLLLVLPDGELNEYLCSGCGTSLGTRRVQAPPPKLAR